MSIDCKKICERYSRLKAERDGYWLNVWREVRKFVYPTYSDYLTEGGVRGQDIFDTTAIEARKRLAAGMFNWMAPPDKRWFELVCEDDKLAEDGEVKNYFSDVTKVISMALANSNWSSVLIQTLNNLACGMDGIVYCEEGHGDSWLNFRSYPIETVCYSEDEFGKVDTLFREMKLTSRQIVLSFGTGMDKGDIPEKILKEAVDPKQMDNKHVILHAVMPRKETEAGAIDKKNMPYGDYYIDLESKHVILEGGFMEFPFAVCRFEKSDNEGYGRGPGIDKLPGIKLVNRMVQSYIIGREHQSDPSWLVPDGTLVDGQFSRDPGAVNVYRPSIDGAKPEQFSIAANLQQSYQDIQEERNNIKTGFFWDIFDPLGDLKQITATEAEIRNEGKLIPFAPIAGNLHNELFRVIIHRVYGICERSGRLPEPPPILAEHPNYKVEFVSKIALSIKKLEALGWLQTSASMADLVALKPDIMDNFDTDKIVRDIALVNGSSPDWLRDGEEVAGDREARNSAAQQQQQAEMLAGGASALGSNLGKAPESGSPLDMVMKGQGV